MTLWNDEAIGGGHDWRVCLAAMAFMTPHIRLSTKSCGGCLGLCNPKKPKSWETSQLEKFGVIFDNLYSVLHKNMQ
jgi:hypothetical protein